MFGSPRFAGAGSLAVALWLCASGAAAEAEVMVNVKDKNAEPAEGRVELKDAEGTTVAACTTQAGRCQLSAVPGGSYTVHLTPAKGPSPKPTKAMIPPEGKVTLIVNTGS